MTTAPPSSSAPSSPPDAAALDSPAETLAAILHPGTRANLYAYLDRLRELEPLHPSEALHGRPAWLITRYDDADEILSNRALISDEQTAEIFNTGDTGRHFFDMIRRTLLYTAPADHARQRQLLAKFFTPRAMGSHERDIGAVVDDLLDGADERARNGEEVDLVADLAYALPTHVICNILGLRPDEVAVFHDWLGDFARRGDVAGVTPEVERRGEEATLGFTKFFQERIDERRRRPRDDLMTHIIEARDAEGALSDDELVAIFVLMIQAGHETTADQISLGMLALLRHPDQLRRLRDDPSLIRNTVEEILRYDGSNQLLQRVGTEDFELRGVTIRAGEVCGILSGAANRDPDRFERPNDFDIHRAQINHFGFGKGDHICVGAALARLEMQSMIGGLVARFPSIELAEEEPEYRESLVLRGLKRLNLRLR